MIVKKKHNHEYDQKFPRGTVIKIADDLGDSMNHFQSGVFGIVHHSYRSEYDKEAPRPKSGDSYGIFYLTSSTKSGRQVSSWYSENQLRLATDEECGRSEVVELIKKYRRG